MITRYSLQIGSGEPEMIETSEGAWVRWEELQARDRQAIAVIARLLRLHEDRTRVDSVVIAGQMLEAGVPDEHE
jgi:hypothetical protein